MDEQQQYYVYMHKNKINGKVYVGQTTNPKRRWRSQGVDYETSSYFYNAIQKYGWDNFEHIILKENLTLEEANYWEIYYIQLYNSAISDYGYNIRGGDSNGKLAESTKEKLSQIAKEKERWKGDKNPRHIYPLYGEENPMYGKRHIEETKQKISKANKGKIQSEETKQQISKTLRQNHPKAKKVRCIETGEIFNSARQAAEAYNTAHTCITRVCNGERKTTHNLHWEWYDDLNS